MLAITSTTALQVCSRCRKKRVKCNLQLPSCKNCRIADVECLYWDDSLGQNIPCSYLHSLRQKVQSLKLAIQSTTDQNWEALSGLGNRTEFAPLQENDYHLNLFDHDGLASASYTAYLGSGNSARLLERLLKSTILWHSANNVQLPKLLLADTPSYLIGNSDSMSFQSFPMIYEQRKIELHTLVPPSTQRALIETYLEVVSPEYSLLSIDRESILLVDENPLKRSSSNKDDQASVEINIVFALAAALVSRDLEPDVFSIFMHCREDLQKVSQRAVYSEDPVEMTRSTCQALSALALCEFIKPISGQLWDLLGRAAVTLEHLRDGYHLRYLSLDETFRNLERSLLKLECYASSHFDRPSQLCEIRLRSVFEHSFIPDALGTDLRVLCYLNDIARHFKILPRPSEETFEGLIPLHLQINSTEPAIDIYSAALYTALHPLFTDSDICSTSLFLSRLFPIIAKSARTRIDHFVQLNESNKIISIWIAADQILEAGAVWAMYVISQHCATTSTGERHISNMGTSVVMDPILKVSTLLASIAARWKRGTKYVEAWETFVQLLWNILR